MNLLPLKHENRAENLRRLQLPGVWKRCQTNIPEATTDDGIDYTEYDWIMGQAKILKKKLVVVLYAQIPNKKYWRQFYDGIATPEDVWLRWKVEDADLMHQDWKNPNGIYPWLKTPVLDVFEQYIVRSNPGTAFAPDNEPGDTDNKRRPTWGSSPSGIAHPSFVPFALEVCKLVKAHGFALATTAAETEDRPTFDQQFATCTGSQLSYADYVSVNAYMVRFEFGDTPEAYAAAFWNWIKTNYYVWSKKKVIVTEFYPFGSEESALEDACISAVLKTKPSWCVAAILYDVRIS